MGKKTNWTTAEDQTLCRVWLTAGDLQLQGVDQKASNFWNVVRELFHHEMETTVERPLNGLKVRWTRINKDSQKFASIYSKIHSMGRKLEEENSTYSSDATVAPLTEQQWIDEAKDAFYRYYKVKFSFEGCWKQLRSSSKWLHLFTVSNNYPTLSTNTLTTSSTNEEAARAPSSSSSEEEVAAMDDSITTTSAANTFTAISEFPPCFSGALISSAAAAAAIATITQASNYLNTLVNPLSHKRKADTLPEHCSHSHIHQLQELTVTLVEELKRQNNFLEDQNAIALLKVDGELLSDTEAQHSYQLLRARYLKKARPHHTCNNDARTNTLV